MFGFIHDSVRIMIVRKYGEELWKQAVLNTHVELDKASIVNYYYPDSDTNAIIDSLCLLSRMQREELWEEYGAFLVNYVLEIGWDEMLACISPDLNGFINNLDSLHYFIDHVVYKANLKGPSFRSELNEDGSITLHYFSERSGLYPIVKGVLSEIGRQLYDMQIQINVVGRTQRIVQMSTGEKVEEHVVFQIRVRPHSNPQEPTLNPTVGSMLMPARIASHFLSHNLSLKDPNERKKRKEAQQASKENSTAPQQNGQTPTAAGAQNVATLVVPKAMDATADWQLKLNQTEFMQISPYHFIMDRDGKLIQLGKALAQFIPPEHTEVGTPIIRIFEIHRPQIPLDYENICNFINGVFILQLRNAPLQVTGSSNGAVTNTSLSGSALGGSRGSSNAPANYHGFGQLPDEQLAHTQHLKLKGQMLKMGDSQLLYMCSPFVQSVDDLLKYGIRLSGLSLHDSTRDLIFLNEQRKTDADEEAELQERFDKCEKMADELDHYTEQADSLLGEMYPPSIGTAIAQNTEVPPQNYDSATIMFVDCPTASKLMSQSRPLEFVSVLNALLIKYDRLMRIHGAYKVEAVNDSFMAVCGAPETIDSHCERMCHIALGLLWEAHSTKLENGDPVTVRCGMSTGPIVTGVSGGKTQRYCVFGETVRFAQKMLLMAPPGRIHCSPQSVRAAQQTGRFEFVERGMITIRGSGSFTTSLLKKSLKKSIWEIVEQERDVNLHSIDGYAELFAGLEADIAKGAAENGALTMNGSIDSNGMKASTCSLS